MENMKALLWNKSRNDENSLGHLLYGDCCVCLLRLLLAGGELKLITTWEGFWDGAVPDNGADNAALERRKMQSFKRKNTPAEITHTNVAVWKRNLNFRPPASDATAALMSFSERRRQTTGAASLIKDKR